MITPRLLSVLKFSCQFYLIHSRNFSSSGKYHVIKVFNTENKYLYGNLVETQKQRRKKVTKTVDNECKSEDLVAQKSTDILEETAKDNKKIGIHLRESTEEKIKKSKSTKAYSAVPSQSSYKKNEIDLNLSSDQFVFASTVPLSVENYPLINSDKSQFYSKNCELQNVYSYSFKDPSLKYSLTYPSVSKIIEDTMSEKNKKILERWRQNMIKELGEEGFYKQNEATKARGHEFHTAVLHRVLGKEIGECSEVTNNALDSLSWMLDEVSHPMAVESVIAHPQLGYKGVFDCVALFRNIPVVIDWKLSDKPKKDLKDTYDAPVQVTAYIGAINHDPNYKWGVDHGLVAVAYTNGDPCDVFLLAPKHCQIYWKHWLLRLDKFKARSHLHLDHDIDEKALQLT